MYTRRKMRRAGIPLLLVFLMLLCVGCGAESGDTREEETKTLGLLVSQETPFLSELRAAIEAEAAEQGYTVAYYNAGDDAQVQLRQIHQALADGVETLLVNLTDGTESEEIAQIVGDAGVVLVNRAPEGGILDENLVFVGVDEAQSGLLQGWALSDYFWESEQGTDIRYLLFQGVPGQENTDARSGAAIQTLLNNGFFPVAAAEYQVCGFSRERARYAMEALLARDVDFDCVICDNDEMALGVIEALEATGRDPGAVPIVSVDDTAAGAAALEAGKLYMTVDQNVETQAKVAVAAAINLNQGLPFDDGMEDLLEEDYATPVQPYEVRVPVEAVTA